VRAPLLPLDAGGTRSLEARLEELTAARTGVEVVGLFGGVADLLDDEVAVVRSTTRSTSSSSWPG
jgi:hypothetical protein